MLDAIERIEVAIRVDVAYLLGEKDKFAYAIPSLLHSNFSMKINPETGTTKHQDWLLKHAQMIARSKEDFAQHYKTKYGIPLPIWVAVELWDFGLLSTFYQGMIVSDKTAIASKYNIPDWQVMESWLHCINYVRNVAAHHSRLWNRNLVAQPKLAKSGVMPDFDLCIGCIDVTSRVYIILCILAHFMAQICPRSTWAARVVDLIGSFPKTDYFDIAHMGFPVDWESHRFWKK